jgi:hypothetical protein
LAFRDSGGGRRFEWSPDATVPFKLLEAAEGRWRAVNGPHLVALVRAGARFEKGRLVERPKEAPEEENNEVAA